MSSLQVDEATSWVSQVVVTQKKSGALRICIDPLELNKTLLREHLTLPVFDYVLRELGQSSLFSKGHLQPSYWHVQIDEESDLLHSKPVLDSTYGYDRHLESLRALKSSKRNNDAIHDSLVSCA